MGKRHSPEQIVLKLRQADEKLASGASLPEVVRELEISQATYHRWRNRYGAVSTDLIRRTAKGGVMNRHLYSHSSWYRKWGQVIWTKSLTRQGSRYGERF